MISFILLPFALATNVNLKHQSDDTLTWYPNMKLGNSAKFASQNLLSEVNIGAQLDIRTLPVASCKQTNNGNEWMWSEDNKDSNALDKIRYNKYLTVKPEDICGTDGGSPVTACFDASKKDVLLNNMSTAVEKVFKDFEPLINKCVDAFKAKTKEQNDKCKVDTMYTWEILAQQQSQCDKLKFTELNKEGLVDKYNKLGNMQQWQYAAFDQFVKEAAIDEFFKAGGKCLRLLSNSEKIDPATCEVVTHFESDAMTKSTGNAILIMVGIAVATAILGAMIMALVYGCKYCTTSNNDDYRSAQV